MAAGPGVVSARVGRCAQSSAVTLGLHFWHNFRIDFWAHVWAHVWAGGHGLHGRTDQYSLLHLYRYRSCSNEYSCTDYM